MKFIKVTSFFALLLCIITVKSNGQDTIRITAKEINTKVLREGTHRYLVYFKMGKNAPVRKHSFGQEPLSAPTLMANQR